MKKQNQLVLPVILVASLFIFSCSNKEDTPAPAPKTKTQLIMQGSWSFDKALSGSFDVSSQVPACYKDNVVTFTSSSAGTVSSTVTCTPTDVTPPTFTWSWQSSETILALNAPLFPGGTGNFTLVSLTETALVVSQDVNFGTGTANITFYYKH
ncbi:MAG: hypothetical protein U0U70_13675 [Chitinophagaceae bacterium]